MSKITRDNVEKIRIFNKMTSTKMADIMGISRAKYNNFKNDARELKENELLKLRVNLGIDLNKLMTESYVFSDFEKALLNDDALQIFTDCLDYDINNDQIITIILNNIFQKYFSEKSFYEKILQNNRAIIDFSQVLYSLTIEKKNKISRDRAKNFLIDKIRESKLDISEKRVKRNILDKIEILDEKDCYYILTFNKLAAKIILKYIPKHDFKVLKGLGYKQYLVKLGY